ncbi:FAD-binding oxidoreductase [Candidatus Woesearchaeota archaeon]|nr:FAD-binding oxidoreductase [Candidatus Woesearchaeota archaeon]
MAEGIVAVVGGGHSGASSAYHLAEAGLNVLVFDKGKLGKGPKSIYPGYLGPDKMIVTGLEPDPNSFLEKHSPEVARTFVELTHSGLDLQVSLARQFDERLVQHKGSLEVGTRGQLGLLKQQYESARSLGIRNGFKEKAIDYVMSFLPDANFDGGLYHTAGATIKSVEYVGYLLSHPRITVVRETKVTGLEETIDGVTIRTDKGETEVFGYAVVATNGFFKDKNLEGKLKPKWSLILLYNDPGKDTPNIWTCDPNFFYFLRRNGIFSVGKRCIEVIDNNIREFPSLDHAIQEIEEWVKQHLPHLKGKRWDSYHYGIYADTTDFIPIVGRFEDKSRIIYIVGCNGYNQAGLSYAASFIPFMIVPNLRMNTQQERFAEVLSPANRDLIFN